MGKWVGIGEGTPYRGQERVSVTYRKEDTRGGLERGRG